MAVCTSCSCLYVATAFHVSSSSQPVGILGVLLQADNLINISRSTRPKNTLPLLTSTVKLDADDPAMRCCFRVVSPEGTYTLQAESEYERTQWIHALQVGPQ